MGKLSNTFNFNETKLFLVLSGISSLISFMIAKDGIMFGALIVTAIVLSGVFAKAIVDFRFGFILLITYGFFLFLLDRLFASPIPYGVGIEIIECIILFAILIKGRNSIIWIYFRNPVTVGVLLVETFNVLQAFNPNSISIAGWLYSIRGIIFTIILYFIVVVVFTDFSFVKRFTKYWLALALLAAIYGIYQELFGYSDFEWRAIYSAKTTYGLINMGTVLRKFSFLSDVAAFGLLMAFSGIFCCVLALGPYKLYLRIILIASAVLMFAGMTYSGTRTAIAMLPVGVIFYALMSINKPKTWVFLSICVIVFVAVLFGPFYSGPLQRLKTTFQFSEDASMKLRDINRLRIQPSIRSHPMGGGVFTTGEAGHKYSPGHYLAGFEPDGGYLKVALERGWIGLIFVLALYFVIMKEGLVNYFQSHDPTIRNFYAAYLCSFFSLSIANFAQEGMYQKPIGLITISIYALMSNMIKFEK